MKSLRRRSVEEAAGIIKGSGAAKDKVGKDHRLSCVKSPRRSNPI
jgi:hypothetical protein